MSKKKRKTNLPQRVFSRIHEKRLTRLGWPSAEKLLESARSSHEKRVQVAQGLNVLANLSGDEATAAKARAILEQVKKIPLD